MRSHVTPYQADYDLEVVWFQYRKRYEITCDNKLDSVMVILSVVSIPQAV